MVTKNEPQEETKMIDALKPNEWADKSTRETKQGLSITVNNSLSHDDIQKQCAKPQTQTIAKATGVANQDLF